MQPGCGSDRFEAEVGAFDLEVEDTPTVLEMNRYDPQIRASAEVDEAASWDPRDVDAT